MVAIKDMEMPKCCNECPLFHFYIDLNGVIHFICKCGNTEMCGDFKKKRKDFCPLIEVDKMTVESFKEDVLDAISRIGLWKSDTKEVQAVEECLRAVEKLQPMQKPGHWVEEIINIGSRKVFCSECGCFAPFEYVSNGDVYSASGSYGVINKTKFCPNCGKRMVEQQESEVLDGRI